MISSKSSSLRRNRDFNSCATPGYNTATSSRPCSSSPFVIFMTTPRKVACPSLLIATEVYERGFTLNLTAPTSRAFSAALADRIAALALRLAYLIAHPAKPALISASVALPKAIQSLVSMPVILGGAR